MDHVQHCDSLVLGSGEAGKYIAWTLAKAGQQVVVIERSLVGGACPNVACLPSKNVIHGGHVAALARRGEEFGVVHGPVHVDMAAVRERKRKMVRELVVVHEKNYAASGAELVMGEGRFIDARTIEVQLQGGGKEAYRGDRVFLNVGTHAGIPELAGLRESQPLTHVEALELGELPEHLIVLGGGYIGLEFAQPMRRFGSRVTVVEQGPQVAGREDPDVAQALMDRFAAEGIEVLVGVQPQRVEGRSGERIRLHLHTDEGARVVEGSHLLVAAGRVPNTRGIGLEEAGIALDERGFVKVNERLETTAKDVWALGDCAGSPQFTHASFDDFRIVRDNLLDHGNRTTKDRPIPYCVFTDPELGRIGLTERQAREQGYEIAVAKMPMSSVARALEMDESRGLMKAIVDSKTDQILGGAILGVWGGEMMTQLQLAMMGKLTSRQLSNTVFAHPTLGEAFNNLFSRLIS